MWTWILRFMRIADAESKRKEAEQRTQRDFKSASEVAKFHRSQFGTLLPTNDEAKRENEQIERRGR